MFALFHPALVHFSVAFLVVGASCEAYGVALRRERAEGFGSLLLRIGAVSLIPTLLSGYIAANTVSVAPAALDLLDAHERNGWILLGLVVAGLFWKGWTGGKIPQRQRAVYAALLLGVVALTLYSALLGGQMVYLHGIGVR